MSGRQTTEGTAELERAVEVFMGVRPRLFGIAYRMLGSALDAEDVVQDAWLRWQRCDRDAVREPAAYLAATATRLAIDALHAARARREAYLGPWLPEPVDTEADPELVAEHDEMLEFARLVLLERLGPRERAAFVLREAFGYPYRRIAAMVKVSEAAARQLVHRARVRLGDAGSPDPSPSAHRRAAPRASSATATTASTNASGAS